MVKEGRYHPNGWFFTPLDDFLIESTEELE
jgi:hypothetical protein